MCILFYLYIFFKQKNVYIVFLFSHKLQEYFQHNSVLKQNCLFANAKCYNGYNGSDNHRKTQFSSKKALTNGFTISTKSMVLVNETPI